MAQKIRVLIIDDHPLFRQGIRWSLEAIGDMEVVGEAENGQEAIKLAERLLPDVVLVDINLPGLNGLEVARVIKRRDPRIGMIVLSVYEDDDQLFQAIKVGAAAYSSKDVHPNALVNATRAKLSEKKVKDATTTADYVKGAFMGDSALSGMLSKLRLGMGGTYGSAPALDDLSDIGIAVPKAGQSKDSARAGTLTIDEAKLTDALNADAQGVRALLGGTAIAGFAQDIEAMTRQLGDVLDSRVDSLGTQAKRMTDEMTRMDTRLAAKEKPPVAPAAVPKKN